MLWVLIAVLILLSTFSVFKILAGRGLLAYGGLFLASFVGVIFLYIKSVLNYFSIILDNNKLFIYKFKQLVHKGSLKEFSYELEELEKPKNFKRIQINWKNESVSVSNLEFSNFDKFYKELKKQRILK